MRNVVLFMHMSLDGFCADEKGGLNWIPYNDELQKFGKKVVDSVGIPLYGRVTYELMKGYWHWAQILKDPAASDHDRSHTLWLENVEKIVFSKTLKKSDWKNTRVIGDNIAAEILKLKKMPGKDLVIFGSPTLARSFMELGLIDEYQLTISPVILGHGKKLFQENEMTKLILLDSQTLTAGVVALHYKVSR